MMGPSHYQVAAASWVGAMSVGAASGLHLDPASIGISACACLASGLLPDLDHPNSSVTSNLGTPGRALSWCLRKVGRGHRGATHSIGGALMAGGLTWAAHLHPLGLAVLMAVLVATALDLAPWTPEGSEWWFAAGAAVLAPALTAGAPWWLLPGAVAWGWHSHLVADMLTKQPIPYLWPLRSLRDGMAVRMFRTGGAGERRAVWALWILVGWLVLKMTPVER